MSSGWTTSGQLLVSYWLTSCQRFVNFWSTSCQLFVNFTSTFSQLLVNFWSMFYWTSFPAASPILDTTGCTKSATAYNDIGENGGDENYGGGSCGEKMAKMKIESKLKESCTLDNSSPDLTAPSESFKLDTSDR